MYAAHSTRPTSLDPDTSTPATIAMTSTSTSKYEEHGHGTWNINSDALPSRTSSPDYTTQLFSLRPGIKTYFDDILMFDHEAGYNGEWRQIESMKIRRTFHSMSVVNFNKIKDYCN